MLYARLVLQYSNHPYYQKSWRATTHERPLQENWSFQMAHISTVHTTHIHAVSFHTKEQPGYCSGTRELIVYFNLLRFCDKISPKWGHFNWFVCIYNNIGVAYLELDNRPEMLSSTSIFSGTHDCKIVVMSNFVKLIVCISKNNSNFRNNFPLFFYLNKIANFHQ